MSAYQYHALKKNGGIRKGVIEADSERHARQILREQHLILVELKPLQKTTRVKHRHRLSSQDLALLTRQLATLLVAGIPIDEALKGVIEQTEKEKNKQLMIGVRAKVLEGYSLAQALDEFSHTFPELYRATVAAGEQTGQLGQVLEKLADYTEQQQVTRQKIQQALIYPSLMIVVSVSIISFLLAFVVPKIIEVFTTSGQTLPLTTLILIKSSTFIKNDGLYLVSIVVLLIFLFKRSLTYPRVKLSWHTLLLKLPIIAHMVRTTNVARYIHTFAILFASGVSVLETMRVSASLVNNEIMRQAFNQATIKVREGTSISQALKETRYLTPMAIHLIASGEKSGLISNMMERAAINLDADIKRIIDTSLTLLEPLVILCMGGVVLFIVLATLLPIFSMEQLVT